MNEKKKPTIAELEAILDGNGPYGGVEILPDGSIKAFRADEISELRSRLARAEKVVRAAHEWMADPTVTHIRRDWEFHMKYALAEYDKDA